MTRYCLFSVIMKANSAQKMSQNNKLLTYNIYLHDMEVTELEILHKIELIFRTPFTEDWEKEGICVFSFWDIYFLKRPNSNINNKWIL